MTLHMGERVLNGSHFLGSLNGIGIFGLTGKHRCLPFASNRLGPIDFDFDYFTCFGRIDCLQIEHAGPAISSNASKKLRGRRDGRIEHLISTVSVEHDLDIVRRRTVTIQGVITDEVGRPLRGAFVHVDQERCIPIQPQQDEADAWQRLASRLRLGRNLPKDPLCHSTRAVQRPTQWRHSRRFAPARRLQFAVRAARAPAVLVNDHISFRYKRLRFQPPSGSSGNPPL